MVKTLNISSKDDDLYSSILDLLSEIKLTQGGTALASTLRRHPVIKKYLIQKQVAKLSHFEDFYFLPDGDLDIDSLK